MNYVLTYLGLMFTLASLNESNVVQSRELLKQDINEIQQLVDQYLSFSKQEHEIPELEFVSLSLESTITTYVEQLGQYSDKSVNFNCEYNGFVNVDLRFLSRAIKNIIDNAFKYSDNEIVITLKRDGNLLILQVDDDGAGLNTSQVDDLFLPYTRANNSQLGYGLGLAITKKIIEWHHGIISAGPSAVLSGACFQLKLPLANEKVGNA